MKKTAKVILRAFFAIALITSVGFLSGRAVAASNPLTVTDANIVSKSDGVTASIAGVSGNEIANNVRFNKLGDKVDYKITLKNSGDKKLTIKSVADDNSNTYISYSYGAYAGTEIAAGASFDFEFAATYSSAIPDRTARDQRIDISFSFAYETEAGETGNSEIIVAPTDPETPKTADTPYTVDEVLRYVGIFVACAFGLVLSIFLIRSANKKLKSAGLALALLVAAGIALPMTVAADDNLSAITFKSNYEIMSRLAVTYNDGTEDRTIEIENGDTLEGKLQNPQIDGYIFNGWLDENDEPFDLTQPVTDDVNIHPDLTPIQYTLYIDIDGDYSYSLEVKLKYDQEYQLPTLSRDKWQWGMKHDGWLDRGLDWSAEDDDKRYGAGQVVKGLSSTQDDEIWLETTWSGRTYAVVYQNVDDETFLSAAPTEVSYDEFEANAWQISLPGTPVKEGYQFGGWKFNGDGPYTVDYIIALLPEESDDFVVEATWEKKAMQVCYFSGAAPADVTGESKCDTLDYDDTGYTIAHNYFTRTGYDPIDGWRYGSVDYTGGQSFDVRAFTNACARPDHNHCSLNLTARWTPRQTVMHFVPGADDATGEVEDAVFTYDQPASGGNSTYTRPGYTHRGWSCDYGSTYGTVTYVLSGITTNAWKHDVPEVTCSAVWDKNWYWIVFDKNAQDATGGMYGMTVTYGDTTPLNQNQFVREGYRFIGWKRNNEGDLIADGASAGQFPVAANEETITLYAQWEEVGPTATTFADAYSAAGKTKATRTADGEKYYTLQDMNSSICSAVSLSTKANYSDTQEIQVMDARDEKLYWIAKTLDGKCWMTQNLDLDLSTNKTLTHADTDLGWGNEAAPTTWTPSSTTVSVSSNDDLAGLGSGDYEHPESIDVGDWYWTDTWYSSGYYYYLDIANNGAGDKFSTTPYAGNGTHGHVGNYYNWTAVMTYNNFGRFSIPGEADYAPDLQNSICPAGWRLPTISTTDSSKDDYANLNSIYNGTNTTDKLLTVKPLYFIRAGEFIGSNQQNAAGATGMYWSGSTDQGARAHAMLHKGIDADNSINPHYRNNRDWLLPIRCVAR